jgi:hypothetical protein
LLISFTALIYSCKKDETTKLHTTEAITNQPEKIDPAEIVSWIQNLPFKLPTDPAWAQASQATINNEFVVKVPVGVDAALFFVKKNGVLQAYTYKWLYEKTDSTGFNGKLDIFNFQTNRLDRLIYKNGDNIKTVTLDNATPAQTPVVQTNQKTNSIDIGRTIAKIWCWLTGGTWYDIWNYGFNCVYPDAGPDYGNETSAGDYYSGIFGNGGIPPVVGGGGGGSSSGGGGDWVPAPGTGDCGPKVAVVGSGKLRVQLLPPGGGCPPGGGDGTYQPYPIPTPTPQTGDHYDATFVKSLAIVKITSIINETEAQYQIQLGLTDLEKAQFAAKFFDVYRTDFNTNFASLQINVDGGDDPPFIAWLRSKLRKMLGIDAPNNAVESQQINNELSTWGTIGQRVQQLRIEWNGNGILLKPNLDEPIVDDNLVFTDPTASTVYQEYQNQQAWPTIDRIIPFEKFVTMRFKPDGDPVSCLILAREQLAKAGYTCSGYLPGSQTFQVYSEVTGVNQSKTRQAITYLINSLSANTPVIVGIDRKPGSINYDGATDHFIVINGMGTDAKGKYFQFIDNSTSDRIAGASYANRLYYNSTTGKITGSTQSPYGHYPGSHDYIVSQVRKSIKL